jgi:hypothetical protein
LLGRHQLFNGVASFFADGVQVSRVDETRFVGAILYIFGKP